MESYEEFIRRHSGLDGEDEEDRAPGRPSSVIVFHGAPVLPPLLDEEQRLEMRRLRDTAVSLMERRRMKMRREEESHSRFPDVSDDITDSDILSSALPTLRTRHPLTSTAEDGRSANQLRASPEDPPLDDTQMSLFEDGGHKTLRSRDDRHSQVMTMSSGYVTNDNTDGRLNTTAGSDIISHAPVDGALLEEESVAPPPQPADDVTEQINPPSDPDEGPYQMSLQNLLKKSQEHRRRQRLLRSQAKALSPGADEHSLSDKENEELPKQIWRTELRKARQRRKTEEDAGTRGSNQALQGDGNAPIHPAELPVLSRSQQRAVSACRPLSAAWRRFTNIPAPTFCLSPVRCKKAGGIPGAVRKALTESDPSGSANGGGMRTSAQTQQIAQLELNLSSLKALISDLESTLTLTHPTGSPSDDCRSTRPSAVAFGDAVRQEHSGSSREAIEASRAVAGVLTDTSNHSERGSCLIGSSYDVDAPSSLWSRLTPEAGGHEGVSRVKRRLLMTEAEPEAGCGTGVMSSVLQTPAQTQEDQVTALMEDERRRQQEVLQSLAERYQFLRSVSFPCPGTDSRLEDTPTSALTSSVCTHPDLTHTRHSAWVCVSALPLLAALVKGFLTRRLLQTERVSRLVTTITARRELPLSAATRKALERRKRITSQQRSADRKRCSPSDEDKWNLVPKICRVSRKNAPLRGAR